MDVWFFPLDTPRIRGSIKLPFYHFPSRVPHSTALDFDLQLRKQLALAAFFFFSLWGLGPVAFPGLQPAPPLLVCFYWKQSYVFVFIAFVGNERWGVPWSTFEWGIKGACGGEIAFCTQCTGKHSSKPRHPKSMTSEFSHSFSKHSI